MHRVILLVAGVLLVLAGVAGCGTPAPPTRNARATDFALQQAVAPTYFAQKNATATVEAGVFARVKPLLAVSLADGGAAANGTAVRVTVQNGDAAQHTVVIRLYDRAAPLTTQSYAVGRLELGAQATGTLTITSPLPFASVAAQILQIDGIWDFGPPKP